jgi:hypothetical protein
MTTSQNSKADMGSFVWITDMTITFVLFAYFNWNFLVAAAFSAIVGELFIRNALTRKTVDDDAPEPIAIMKRGWWLIVGITIVPVLCVLVSAPGRRLSGGDYIWGELIIVIALAKAGWVDLNHNRELRAVILFLSCIGWVLLLLSILGGITTVILLFVTLGLTAIAFFWSLVESLFIKEKSNGSV